MSVKHGEVQPAPQARDIPEPEKWEILVAGDWFLEDLGKFPRQYVNLYSFIYSLVNLDRPSVRSNVAAIYRRYPWRGGFSTVNFFRELKGIIPSLHEPEVVSMTYASPGKIELELLAPVARVVASSLGAAEGNLEKLDELSKTFSVRQRLEKWAQIDGSLINIPLSDSSEQFLHEMAEQLSSLLGLGIYKDELLRLAPNSLVATKILLSFFRRLKKLHRFNQRNLVYVYEG
ncbi:MAG: hypothetical protein AAGM16_06820 [Pseudomonadota bacterium]